MLPLIQTLNSNQFPLDAGAIAIFSHYNREFFTHGLDEERSMLFANISFLVSYRPLVDFLLGHLEAEVAARWREEQDDDRRCSTLVVHSPQEFVNHFGLMWPMPKAELAQNRSRHLLSRVLLETEQRHQINMINDSSAPVPTFIGYIVSADAEKILAKNQLWNEDPKMSPLFYHGKMTHRIQLYFIMKAVELKIMDLGGMTVSDLLQTMATSHIPKYKETLAWNPLLDYVVTTRNIVSSQTRNSCQHMTALTHVYEPTIQSLPYESPYVYGCDPYFLHSYLMTASRSKTPHLSECITQIFCKSAFAIQAIEKRKGYAFHLPDYYIRDTSMSTDNLVSLSTKDLTMEAVLKRQALTYSVGGNHAIKVHDILIEQAESRKLQRIDAKTSFKSLYGIVQYRSIFSAPGNTDLEAGDADEAVKRRRVDSPSLSAGE